MYFRTGLCISVMMLAMLAGCVQPAANQPTPPDPFANPADCPDGICPVGAEDTSAGIEIGYSNGGLEIDSMAATEPKFGDQCLPCLTPTSPTTPQASPQTLTPQQSVISNQDEIKHGAFRCEKCQQPVVGAEWEDLWTDEGLSLHCMCKACFAAANPHERENTIKSFLSRADPSLIKLPSVQAAIQEISSR